MFNRVRMGILARWTIWFFALIAATDVLAGNFDLHVDCPDNISVSTDQELFVNVEIENETNLPIAGPRQLAVSMAGTKSSLPVIYGPFTRNIDLNLPPLGSQNFVVLVSKPDAALKNKLAIVGVGIRIGGDDIEALDKCVLRIQP